MRNAAPHQQTDAHSIGAEFPLAGVAGTKSGPSAVHVAKGPRKLGGSGPNPKETLGVGYRRAVPHRRLGKRLFKLAERKEQQHSTAGTPEPPMYLLGAETLQLKVKVGWKTIKRWTSSSCP